MTSNNNTQVSDNQNGQSENSLKFDATGQEQINIPAGKFISDAEIAREGQDLTLETSDGDKLVVENYFSVQDAPVLHSPDGSILTENLVNSFLTNSDQYAQMGTLNDESPIGAVEELEGTVTIIRADGSSEIATLGTPVYEGDVVETGSDGAANILFLDETSLAVSDNARMSVDNYKFDPATESGETNLSVLRGVFVYTSGLIGRDDPDDVLIETPVGSIGIRGTIIAGNINPEGKSEITVLEGAIVVSNGEGEVTLSQQFETVKINGFNDSIEPQGVKEAGDMKASYGSVQNVIPKLFSSINDNIRENETDENVVDPNEVEAQETGEDVIEVTPEENVQEDLNSEMMEPGQVDGIKETIKEAVIDGKPQNKPANFDKEELKEIYKERYGRFSNEDGPKDPYYNPFNGGTDGTTNPWPNVDASGARLSGAIAPQTADYNGDGIQDHILADPNAFGGFGTFKVISGADSSTLIDDVGSNITDRLGTDFDLIGDANNDGTLDFIVSGKNGTDGVVYKYEVGNNTPAIDSGISGEQLGSAVAGIGDFDGDGRSDYAVGLSGAAGGNGAVEINLGAGGTINSTIGATGTEFGAYVDGLGDINGDGLSDLLIGTENQDGGLYKAYIVHGHTSDGTFDTEIVSPHEIVAGGGIGDINGDGLDDFAISFNDGGVVRTYAVYGQPGALPGSIDYTFLDNPTNALRIMHGVNLNPGQDYEVFGIGDKDGDGYDDFQVGVVGGQKFVVHGENNGSAIDDDLADGTADGILTANGTSESLVGNYDFDDNGHFGVSMKGSKYQNEFKVSNANFQNIDGGLGQDTIKIDGNLDFTNVNFEQISQIEKIAMGATDGLLLTEENIFNLLKSSDLNRLYIDGEDLSGGAGDESALTINVDGAPSGSTMNDLAADLGGVNNGVNGASYHHIQIGVYDLYIDTDIAVTIS